MPKDSGFTVLELIIVIAIAGVLTAIAVPNFLTYQHSYRLNGALSSLRGDLYGAKMLAIKRGVQYRVVFAAGGYQIQRGNLSAGSTAYTTEITRNFADEYPGVTVDTSATANPVFSPRGTSTLVTITLQNTQNKTRTITTSLAGRIKVE